MEPRDDKADDKADDHFQDCVPRRRSRSGCDDGQGRHRQCQRQQPPKQRRAEHKGEQQPFQPRERKAGKHESKERKGHKDHEAKHCGKNCKGAPKATPVTISNGVGKTKIKVGPTEVLGLSAKNGTITITEFTGKPGLRTVTFGGSSVTLSSSVAEGLRLRASNGKSHNIEIDNTVSVKQNANGSVTVTANPSPLKGL